MTTPNTTLYSTGPLTDQLEMYDTAIMAWLQADYAIIPGKTPQMLIATPHRAYAEVTSGQVIDQSRLSIPRIAVTRMDEERDPARFNCNRYRYLGKVGTGFSKIRQEQYPVPIDIPYQIEFWPEFQREMNLWNQKYMYQFAMGYKYLQAHVDDVWGDQKFTVMLEGALRDGSELEPQDKPRQIRRIGTVIVKGRLYGQTFEEVPVVKRTIIEVATESVAGPVDETFSPQSRQALYTTPGGVTVFSGGILRTVPVLRNTLLISAYFGGTEVVAEDDGSGALYGPHVASGTINYVTGAVNVTYDTAPDAGTLEASWLMEV